MSQDPIQQLHETYCELTGLEIVCSLNRHYFWEAFATRFTVDDLTLVCRNLKRQVKDGRRRLGCMSFTRLIADLETFEEHLAEFRALQRRVKVNPNRAEVLRATGRSAEPNLPEARTAGNVIRKDLSEKFKQLKKGIQ